MTSAGLLQYVLIALLTLVFALLVGPYMAKVYATAPGGGPAAAPGDAVFAPIERLLYRVSGVDARREQRWNVYALSMLAFSAASLAILYALQRLQGALPFNPTNRPAVGAWGAFNTAVSFVTNTNWQWYSGEAAMSHLTQMAGLTVQNFVSAAAGMAVVVALIRGITRRGGRTLGNFWVDLVRSVVRILLPLSFVFALVLVTQGVIQNFHGATNATTLDTSVAASSAEASPVTTQAVPGGPVASQEAIKQLGTNGGGFFNANSAHPFENPNGWTNLLETVAIVGLPFAFCIAFGKLVGDQRQGFVLAGVMALIWVSMSFVAILAEGGGNTRLSSVGVDQSVSSTQPGGNMEGKDVRFGPAACGAWAGSTTGTSNGSVNCMHDSFTPIGGLTAMGHMMLGEVSPGGVGVGLMGMLVNALLAVFIAGLMVGRTPEYLGKKIQAAEMKLVTLFILAVPLVLLGFAAVSVVLTTAKASLLNPGAHGLSEVLYNYASSSNNNGSAFAGMNASTNWYTITQGISMLVGRFFLIIPALAIGGSLVRKPTVPKTTGTFPTDTALYGALVLGVVFIVAGLTYFPSLALGPILEQVTR